MSSTIPEEDELYDSYEAQTSGDMAPVVSWKFSKVGDLFTGILLPAKPVDRPDKGYEVRREYKQEDKKEGTPAGYTVWPPKNNVEGIKRPVVEAEFVRRWPNEDLTKARKVSQNHLTFETGIVDGRLISERTLTRLKENDKDPNAETRRRVIEQGKDLTDKIAAALKPVGGKPLPGQTWTISIASREPNDYGGETTIYTVKIVAPTPASLKVVADYVETKKIEAAQAEDANDPDDPWATTGETVGASASAEEPPF